VIELKWYVISIKWWIVLENSILIAGYNNSWSEYTHDDNFDKCTKSLTSNKMISKVVYIRIVVSTQQLTLVTWFDSRMLAAINIIWILSIYLLDLKDKSTFSYKTMVLFKLWVRWAVCPSSCKVSHADHSKVIRNTKWYMVVNPTMV